MAYISICLHVSLHDMTTTHDTVVVVLELECSLLVLCLGLLFTLSVSIIGVMGGTKDLDARSSVPRRVEQMRSPMASWLLELGSSDRVLHVSG